MLIGLMAGLVGLALGTFGVLAYRVSEKQRQILDAGSDEPALPAGAAEVLAVVGRAFVVVDAVDAAGGSSEERTPTCVRFFRKS